MTLQSYIRYIYMLKNMFYTQSFMIFIMMYIIICLIVIFKEYFIFDYDCVCLWMASIIAILSLYGTCVKSRGIT